MGWENLRVDAVAAVIAFVLFVSILFSFLSLPLYMSWVDVWSYEKCRFTYNVSVTGSSYLYVIVNGTLGKYVCP